MTTIAANKVKESVTQLLERASKGESITITKRGVAIAVLQPASPERRRKTSEAITQLKKFRRKNRLGEQTVREMIEDGRR